MNTRTLFLFTSIISFNHIHPVITNGIELIHPEENTHIYLFGDWHEEYFLNSQNLPDTAAEQLILQEHAEQSRMLNSFAKNLLQSKGNRLYIITETPEEIIKNFVKHGQQKMHKPSVLNTLPCVFLQHLTQEATTENERFHFLNQNIINTQPTGALYARFNNGNLRWVIGDRFRTFTLASFYVNDREIGSSLEHGKLLCEVFIDLNLGVLKKYIFDWQTIFKMHAFNDICGDRLLNIIDTALQNGFSESDHVISLLEQLDQAQLKQNESNVNIRTAIRELMMDFESQIFDCELEHYIRCINKSHEKNTIVVLAGAGHTDRLSKSLQQQGYFHKKISCGVNLGLGSTVENLHNREKRKKFNSNLEQLLNRISHQNQPQKPSSTLNYYIPYAPAVITGSIGLLSLMSDNSKAKIVAGASIVATPLMALAARYYQTASNQ